MPGGMPVRGAGYQHYTSPVAARLAAPRRAPTLEEALQKVRLGQPLTEEEQAMLSSGGAESAAPAGIAAGSLGPMMDDTSEQQLTPDEMRQMMAISAAPEKEAAIQRRLDRVQSLMDSELPTHSRIGMSSGTSYVPANNWGEVLGTAAKQAVGAYQSRKAERQATRLRQKQEAARDVYARRLVEKPRSQMELDMVSGIQNDMANYRPKQYDFGPTSVWDKLRSYF